MQLRPASFARIPAALILVVGAALLGGCPEPDCDGAADRLQQVCDYDEFQALSYFNACTTYTLTNDLGDYNEKSRESHCIIRARGCDEAQTCQGRDVPEESTPDPDADGDGYVEDDCDEGAPGINPGAEDTPDDGIDQDCNGVDATACYQDDDGDGFGAGQVVVELDGVCDGGLVSNSSDCNDFNAEVNPGAEEVPGDDIDNDCDGTELVVCYWDMDEDTWGGLKSITQDNCDSLGRVEVGGDCDDNNAAVHPGATEVPGNGLDDDCDGTAL